MMVRRSRCVHLNAAHKRWLPYLARQASVKEQQRHALAAEREAGIATGKAKQQVMDTMSHLPISSI
jgi:hypothetical protein